MNVLLVEDDEIDVMNVKRAFMKNDINNQLYVATNGLEALDMLRNIVPSHRRLIILDLNMPKMGGIEFLHKLRTDPALKMIPVVVLTTSNQDRDRIEAYNLNVSGYILKPVTFASFSEAILTLNKYWSLSEMV